MLRHDWEGTRDKETGQFVCDGCIAPELHPDLDDAYDETDKTARHTDIGDVE
jgi:hypothetical protein